MRMVRNEEIMSQESVILSTFKLLKFELQIPRLHIYLNFIINSLFKLITFFLLFNSNLIVVLIFYFYQFKKLINLFFKVNNFGNFFKFLKF